MRARPFKLTAPRVEHEHADQAAVFAWARWESKRRPELRWLFSTLNGVPLRIEQAMRAKAAGLVAGVPDIFLPCAAGGFTGLALELKHGKNRPTEEQWSWLTHLTSQGWFTCVAYGHEAAIGIITEYLEGKCDRAQSVIKHEDWMGTLRVHTLPKILKGKTKHED